MSSSPQDKLPIASTEECFWHFVGDNPTDSIMTLLARFCHVEKAAVLRWLQGHRLPDGLMLLRIRCLLHFAGYGVAELNALPGGSRELALILGASHDNNRIFVEPKAAAVRLGYTGRDPAKGVFEVVLRGRSFSRKTAANLGDLLAEFRPQLDSAAEAWRPIIAAAIGKDAAPPPPPPLVPDIDPEMPVAVAHTMRSLDALVAGVLRHSPIEWSDLLLSLTRGGDDIDALIEKLQQLRRIE